MKKSNQSDNDPLLELSGDIDGLPDDLSESIERYLDETYSAELPTPPPARRRRAR